MKFLRNIRQKLIVEGNLRRYLIYAIGEIFLVVVGILIALQINNWNEDRKERQVEKEILVGIRNDILQDTIDISGNISLYEWIIENNILLLDHLLKKKKYEPLIGYRIYKAGTSDFNLTLHKSHFEEAKQRGLEIIRNDELQQKISRLYEFKYNNLLYIENEFEANNSYPVLNPLISQYISTNLQELPLDNPFNHEDFLIIDPASYTRLLSDKKLLLQIHIFTIKNKSVLRNDYLPTKKEALAVVDFINEELKRLD